ncbi:MAG: single-stranded DNA-binding protein [Desulfosalsimonadaceae bacterium]
MLNKTMLIGRLGRDPETKYSKDGLAITTFSIATTLAWKDKNSGEKKETIEWHRIVTFGKLAEFCSQYLSKGKQIYVEGRLHTRSWEQDNITRYITEILASNVQSLSAKDSGNGASDQQASGHKDSDHHADDSNPPPPEYFPMDDDIPF